MSNIDSELLHFFLGIWAVATAMMLPTLTTKRFRFFDSHQ